MAHINADLFYDRSEINDVISDLKAARARVQAESIANLSFFSHATVISKAIDDAIDVLQDVAGEMER